MQECITTAVRRRLPLLQPRRFCTCPWISETGLAIRSEAFGRWPAGTLRPCNDYAEREHSEVQSTATNSSAPGNRERRGPKGRKVEAGSVADVAVTVHRITVAVDRCAAQLESTCFASVHANCISAVSGVAYMETYDATNLLYWAEAGRIPHVACVIGRALRRCISQSSTYSAGCPIPMFSFHYWLTSRTLKVPFFIGGLLAPSGVIASKSAIGRKIFCVSKSIAIVRAYFLVGTFSTTL
jgi:hypothetical protein